MQKLHSFLFILFISSSLYGAGNECKRPCHNAHVNCLVSIVMNPDFNINDPAQKRALEDLKKIAQNKTNEHKDSDKEMTHVPKAHL